MRKPRKQSDWAGYQALLASRRKVVVERGSRRVVHMFPEQKHGLMSAASRQGEENRVPPLVDFTGSVDG